MAIRKYYPAESLDLANKELSRKIILLMICLVTCFAAIAAIDFAGININSAGYFARMLIASVDLISSRSPIGAFIAASFGNGMLMVPILTVYLLNGDAVGARFRYGYRRTTSGPIKTSLFIYGLAVPTICILIWFVYSIPESLIQPNKLTFGPMIVRAISESRIATVVLGPIIVVGVSLLSFLLAICFVGPFSKK